MDGLDQAGLQNKKMDPGLRTVVAEGNAESIAVIVQTVDGLKEDDHRMVKSLGGTIKDDLYIIHAFSADLSPKAIEMMILSPRVTRIFHDAEVHSH